MSFLLILQLLAGFALLMFGGEFLVRGAVRIASRLGISPLLVGLTIVGLGTSSPELAASIQASISGSPGLALGNIAGSNMANLLLILGIGALMAPLLVPRGVLWRDGGIGVLSVIALIAAGHLLGLSRLAGFLLLSGLCIYLVLAYRRERRGNTHSAAYDKATAAAEADPALMPKPGTKEPILIPALMVLLSLALIVVGGKFLVDGAIEIAANLGVSDEMIGLTVVAIGTSMPELVTSVIAARRGEGEIVLGNVLGSNIYNLLFIGGVTGMIAPTMIPPAILNFDLLLVLGASILVMLFAFTGGRLNRTEGGALLAAYIAYIAYTVSVA